MPQPVKSKRIVRKAKPKAAPLKVVGGAKPTGKLPTVIGTGIFFNPYAVTNIAYQQPSSKWVLERRPGQPLYPGSSGRGIVLIGPSMGDNGDGTEAASGVNWRTAAIIAAAAGLGYWVFWKKILGG
jgi:hypothetical protein